VVRGGVSNEGKMIGLVVGRRDLMFEITLSLHGGLRNYTTVHFTPSVYEIILLAIASPVFRVRKG
jgi:hypothetical protein